MAGILTEEYSRNQGEKVLGERFAAGPARGKPPSPLTPHGKPLSINSNKIQAKAQLIHRPSCKSSYQVRDIAELLYSHSFPLVCHPLSSRMDPQSLFQLQGAF